MEAFFEFMKVVVMVFGALLALTIILLALPASRLRGVLLQMFGWSLQAVTGLCVLYIFNPMDILPDFIPILGQVDDAAALVSALFSGITGFAMIAKGQSNNEALPPHPTRDRIED